MAEYHTPGQPGATGPQGPPGPAGASQINYWYHDDPSDIPTYSEILTAPANGAESDDSVSVVVADGEKLIEAYATDPGIPGVTTIPSGNWTFFSYLYSSVLGVSQVVTRVYRRTDPGGVETELFNFTSPNIATSSPQPVLTNYAAPAFTLAATDRIVVKKFAQTTVAFATVVHFVHDGTLHASWFSTPALVVPANLITYQQSVQGITTALGANGAIQLLNTFSPPTLDANATYSATYSVSIHMWKDPVVGTGESVNMVGDVQINMATNGAGVVTTCVVQQPPWFDTSLGTGSYVQAKGDVTIIAPGNVIQVWGYRPTGVTSKARFSATCLKFEKML